MKQFIKTLTLIIFFAYITACNTTEPPINETLLNLKLEDVSCTEAWAQFTSTGLQLPNTLTLYIDDKVKETINLTTADTLLYVDSLSPNQNYSFQVSSIQHPLSSNELSIRTMDTTSHNFTWQTFTFGEAGAGSSTLYDVAIINENDIWAVGEIYMLDLLGNPDPNAYNAVHWDGVNWELKRIKTNACGGVVYPPIKTIFAFSADDILFVHIDGSISHFNGIGFANDCSLITQLNGSANKIWGISRNDFYVVSGNGFIAHYQNGIWTRIESGTTTNINDAWGVSENGASTIYCPVSSVFNPPQDKKILKITNDKVDSINWRMDRIVYSCWTNNKNFLYVCGDGVFVYRFGTWQQINLPTITTNSIRGNDINDVFAVGALGTIFHFNGIFWMVISSYTQKENYSVDFNNNIVAICGYYNGKGFVEMGRRN